VLCSDTIEPGDPIIIRDREMMHLGCAEWSSDPSLQAFFSQARGDRRPAG
jgi:hypothetical protein